MTTADRIRLLRRHGLENAVIAAVLGVNCDAIADHIADPSIDVAIPGGGGSGDVSGLLPLDGSRSAMLIDIAGVPGNDLSGATLAWDDDWYGVVLSGRPGSYDAEFSTLNPDDNTQGATVYPGGVSAFSEASSATLSANGGITVTGGPGGLFTYDRTYGMTMTEGAASAGGTDRGQLTLAPNDGSGLGYMGLMMRSSAAQVAADVDMLRLEHSPGTTYPLFAVKHDGALHWGDGATTPDRHLHRVDPADPNIGWMPALQMDNGLVIADPDWDGLLVIDPDDYTGNQTWVGPDYVAVMEAVGATHQRATFSSSALTFVGESSQIVLYGDVSALPFGGTASLSAYDSRLYLKKPQGHGAGAVMIAQPGDDSGFGQESFRIDHDGAHHWGAEGAALDTLLQRGGAGNLKIGPLDGSLTLPNGAGDPMTLSADADGFHSDSVFTANGGFRTVSPGDGLRLTSPDGSQTKTLRLSNAGALELV